jgi:hypothetical protein
MTKPNSRSYVTRGNNKSFETHNNIIIVLKKNEIWETVTLSKSISVDKN